MWYLGLKDLERQLVQHAILQIHKLYDNKPCRLDTPVTEPNKITKTSDWMFDILSCYDVWSNKRFRPADFLNEKLNRVVYNVFRAGNRTFTVYYRFKAIELYIQFWINVEEWSLNCLIDSIRVAKWGGGGQFSPHFPSWLGLSVHWACLSRIPFAFELQNKKQFKAPV